MNFDIKRMIKSVEAPSVKVPRNLKGKPLRDWIMSQAKRNEQN